MSGELMSGELMSGELMSGEHDVYSSGTICTAAIGWDLRRT